VRASTRLALASSADRPCEATSSGGHVAEGRNPKWIQQQLGHASITITFDIYGDHFKLHDTEAADALADSLFGNTAGNSRGW
jgi:hypothetical protein